MEEKLNQLLRPIVYALIGLFILWSVWGFISGTWDWVEEIGIANLAVVIFLCAIFWLIGHSVGYKKAKSLYKDNS